MADFCSLIWAKETGDHRLYIVLGPEILVLDEPTAGQDQRNYTEIMEFLDSLQEKRPYHCHDYPWYAADVDYSDRALVVSDGQILADLPPAELFTHPDILQEANLKETSIFALANRLEWILGANAVLYATERSRSWIID